MDPEPGSFLLPFLLDAVNPYTLLTFGQTLFFLSLMLVSFMASAAEVALFSLTRADIELLRNDPGKTSQRIWQLMNEPKRLLATILLTNNFVNIAAILIASAIMHNIGLYHEWDRFDMAIHLGDFHLDLPIEFLVNVIFITAILLLFGEIIPKIYAARHYHQFVLFISGPLLVLKQLLTPLSSLLIRTTRFIDHRLQTKESMASIEEIRNAIDLTAVNADHQEERDILKGIVNLSHITVKSIMRARVDVKSVEVSIPLSELLDYINEHNYSRLPVYEGNLDHILGVLHIKDLLPFLQADHAELHLPDLIRPLLFIPESKKIDSLLEDFKLRRLHMAVVVDEFGGTEGIVTLEDVIEEIFGEINDEFDSEDLVYSKLADDTYIFEGRISLNDLRKILRLPDDEFEEAQGESDSLGGLILEIHGKIPAVGEIIRYKHYEFLVESVSKTRIAMVKMTTGTQTEAEE